MQFKYYVTGVQELGFLTRFMDFCEATHGHKPTEWSETKGDVLVVCWHDLKFQEKIAWQDVNIVIAETYFQIKHFKHKFDPSRSYIFVVESWIEPNVLAQEFEGLNVTNYTVFHEVFPVFNELFQPVSQWTWVIDHDRNPKYNFFCTIGRKTLSREKLVKNLRFIDLSKALVKYHGAIMIESGAPDLDAVGYDTDPEKMFQASVALPTGINVTPAKVIQSSLYHNFKYEVQHETDAARHYIKDAWPVTEFHLTEKTLKPLIAGVPCLMYAAPGFHTWLKSLKIDLGLGVFAHDFDNIADPGKRMDGLIEELKAKQDLPLPKFDLEKYESNMIGVRRLSDLSINNLKSLYNLLKSLH